MLLLEGSQLPFATAPLLYLWLDSSLALHVSGIHWLIQTHQDSVLGDLSQCVTEGSGKEERCDGHRTRFDKTPGNAASGVFCIVALTLG